MGPQKGSADDLTTLGDLDEQVLLEHLNYRFRREIIYTYLGDILLSINPYKQIPGLYGDEVGKRYGSAKTLGELKPHVYALGSRAFHNVHRQEGNQCILVSGESGAGKTEITKMLVAQISRLSQWDGEHFLQDRIVEVNPLLEAFGNASTVMNDNSSRFGKLIELIFSDNGSLLGAHITEHMLEKSRVSRQNIGEKNFHIFYNLICGLTQEERQRYFLEAPEKYRIIDPGHGAPVIPTEIDYKGYANSMNNLRRIMPLVGFTHQDMDVVFALLAAILHLCNIEMAVEPESDEVMVMNEEEIDNAAVLLSVKAEDLITVLMANVNWVRGERLVYIKSLHQAVDGRDALAKALYSKLFSWIVQQINFMLHEDEQKEGMRFIISILDMAGFENFPLNSFEQLCINAANERLQHFFNEHIFALELQEYQIEGIKQPKVKFTNNAELLNMLFMKPIGLFSLLEEECSLAKTTDMSLVDKLNRHCTRQDLYRKSKHREPVFGIVHYAGVVTYNAEGFLEKNRDTLSSNMQSLMENSQNNLVNELFTATVLDTGTLDMRKGSGKNTWKKQNFNRPERRQYSPGDSLSRQAGRKIRQKMKEQKYFDEIPTTANPNSTSAHFKNSLQLLMDRLKGAEVQFIRCIRPNSMKLPLKFDSKLAAEQLRSTGVLETVRIRRLGYAVRLPFDTFIHRYKLLAFPITSHVEPSPHSCAKILKHAKLSDVPIGYTKVFMKHWHCEQLNLLVDIYLSSLVRVQAFLSMITARQHFKHLVRLSQRDADDVGVFGVTVTMYGQGAYQLLEGQVQHDMEKARRETQTNGYYNGGRGGVLSMYANDEDHPNVSQQMRMPDVFSPHAPNPARPSDEEGFYRYILDQFLARIPELDSDVWCKVFYMEYDRPVAKFYLCDREVTIDGSNEEFTGKRIGLGVFTNALRDEATSTIRSYIGKGIQIRKETDGSISAIRLGKNDVIVKGYQNPANHCLSGDVIKCDGLLPSNQSIKIFDMEEFKSHMGLLLQSDQYNERQLQELCISGVSFLQDSQGQDDLTTPCWLCVINRVALDMIQSTEVKREIQQRFVQLSLQDENKLEENKNLQIAAERHQRNWSRLNQRSVENRKKEPMRKTRLQIIQKGHKVQDHMEYSWDEKNYENKGRQLNIADLQEYDRFDEDASILPSPTNQGVQYRSASVISSSAFGEGANAARKDWAKIKVTVKQEKAQLAEEEQKSKATPQE